LELKFNSYFLRCNQAQAVAFYLVRCMPAVHVFLSRLRGHRQCTRVLSSPAPAVFIWFVFGVDLHLRHRTWHLDCPLRSSSAYLSALHDARTWLPVSHRGGRSPLHSALYVHVRSHSLRRFSSLFRIEFSLLFRPFRFLYQALYFAHLVVA
jgi:hypothetical protein